MVCTCVEDDERERRSSLSSLSLPLCVCVWYAFIRKREHPKKMRGKAKSMERGERKASRALLHARAHTGVHGEQKKRFVCMYVCMCTRGQIRTGEGVRTSCTYILVAAHSCVHICTYTRGGGVSSLFSREENAQDIRVCEMHRLVRGERQVP